MDAGIQMVGVKDNIRKISILLLFALFAVLLLLLIYVFPTGVSWKEISNVAIDENRGLYMSLHNRKIMVFESVDKTTDSNTEAGENVLWQSPNEFWVQDALWCDVDCDNEKELLLLLWKKGRYGIYRPFWEKENPEQHKYSQHIFIYEYQDSKEMFHNVWGSSYLDMEVERFTFDGKYVVIEDKNGDVSRWECPGWGLTKADTEISFLAVGDNLIHKPIYMQGLRNNRDFSFLFKGIREELTTADVAAINNETILVDEESMYSDYPQFGTPREVGAAVAEAGFDVVSAATNHALDKGMRGIDITTSEYQNNNVLCVGIQNTQETEYKPYEIIIKKGIRIAMLNYTYGTNGIGIPRDYPYAVHLLSDEEGIRQDIKTAKAAADVVLIFVHWGSEYENNIDDFQKKWTEIFLSEEVDVVIGTHPHVLQPWETLISKDGHKMLIYYSLGNYISTQQDEKCKTGGMARFTISRDFDGKIEIKNPELKHVITEYSKVYGYGVTLEADGEAL